MGFGVRAETADAFLENGQVDAADEFVAVVDVEDEHARAGTAGLGSIGRGHVEEMLFRGLGGVDELGEKERGEEGSEFHGSEYLPNSREGEPPACATALRYS